MTLEEPLSLIAPLAAGIAEQHCRDDDSTGGTCAWYHGTLGYLRLLGVVSSPADDSRFLVPTFARLARDGARRVLISGAGDCSMLAQVLAGFQAAGVVPQLSLFDRCATPIKLNQWFAERHGQTIEATVSDAASYASDAAFDVVCTHCFLGYFTKDERPALFAKWNALLRPGGYVVTVNPIRNVDNDDFVGFGEQQAAAFAARALAAAKDNPEACSGRTDELARRVRAFTDNFGSYPVRSVAEFRGLFEDAGFAVEECENLTDGSGSGGPTEKSLIYQSAVARRL